MASLHPARLLTLALLALPASGAELPMAPDARARALVKSCEQVRLSTGVAFRCPGVLVQLSEAPGGDEQAVLVQQVAGMRATFDGTSRVEPARFTVAGAPRPGARFTVDPKAREAAGMVALVAAYATGAGAGAGAGAVRTISCLMPVFEESLSRRCEALLDGLGTVGPAFFHDSSSDPALLQPRFLGKLVPVPEGCTVNLATADGFQITCPGGVSLAQATQAGEGRAKKALRYLRESALQSTRGAPGKARPCQLGGVKTSCEVVRGKTALVVLGAATVHGQAVVASCSQEPARKAAHPLCAPVLAF